MYVGNRHTARLEATYVRRFTCKACGFESLARVRSKGEGQASSPYFLREQGAKDAARSEAEAKAEENANALVQKARCPSCDQRDEGAVRSEKLGAWLAGTGLGALVSVGVAFIFKRQDLSWPVYGIVSFLTAAFYAASQSWKWGEVDTRVHVLTHSEVESLLEQAEAEEGAEAA